MNEALKISLYTNLVSAAFYILLFLVIYVAARFWTSHRVESVRIWLAKSPLAPAALINRLMGEPVVEFDGYLISAPKITDDGGEGHFALLPGGVWKFVNTRGAVFYLPVALTAIGQYAGAEKD